MATTGAVRLSVTPAGNPAMITKSGTTYWKQNGQWVKMKGCATDIAFGKGDRLFKLGCVKNRNGYGIFKYMGDKLGW